MKKTTFVIVFLVTGGIIIASWITGRITGALNFYTFATEANMPTHQTGSIFFTSNLITPTYGKFIVFNNIITQSTSIFRVIGQAGDIIEIKNGYVYRNKQKLDEPYAWNEYALTMEQYKTIAGYIKKYNNNVTSPNLDTLIVTLTDAELKNYNLHMARSAQPKGIPDSTLATEFKNKGYNVDNLGPVTVPDHSYFVLGYYRHNAMDSRYVGFVKSYDIVATKIGD